MNRALVFLLLATATAASAAVAPPPPKKSPIDPGLTEQNAVRRLAPPTDCIWDFTGSLNVMVPALYGSVHLQMRPDYRGGGLPGLSERVYQGRATATWTEAMARVRPWVHAGTPLSGKAEIDQGPNDIKVVIIWDAASDYVDRMDGHIAPNGSVSGIYSFFDAPRTWPWKLSAPAHCVPRPNPATSQLYKRP